MIHSEVALNLLWALLSVTGLVYFACQERQMRMRRMVSVLLVVVSLFPCISASDDSARMRDLESGLARKARIETGGGPLLAQLEDLERAEIAGPFRFGLNLCSHVLVTAAAFVFFAPSSRDALSRAPPLS
jgi:hypothetical protein